MVDQYTLKQATRRLGYRRKNTVREKFLKSAVEREALGVTYDAQGRMLLDGAAVDALARRLERERDQRGNWRVQNLGDYALPMAERGK